MVDQQHLPTSLNRPQQTNISPGVEYPCTSGNNLWPALRVDAEPNKMTWRDHFRYGSVPASTLTFVSGDEVRQYLAPLSCGTRSYFAFPRGSVSLPPLLRSSPWPRFLFSFWSLSPFCHHDCRVPFLPYSPLSVERPLAAATVLAPLATNWRLLRCYWCHCYSRYCYCYWPLPDYCNNKQFVWKFIKQNCIFVSEILKIAPSRVDPNQSNFISVAPFSLHRASSKVEAKVLLS